MSKLQSVRGMHDLLPGEAALHARLERAWTRAAEQFGYEEIRLPAVEPAELFRRAVGAATDIVAKEMYEFADRGGQPLALRPEGTAGCVRAAIQHGLAPNRQQRLWYRGACFRHERPQQGRLRQFRQFGVEAFGMEGPDIDAELLLLGRRAWRALGLAPTLRLNTLGDAAERAAWREELARYFGAAAGRLDEDDRRRLRDNPLRLLDSRSPAARELLPDAPRLEAHLGAASRAHFDELRRRLDDAGVEHALDPTLVRGLDYYDRTVFEWDGPGAGAQSALAAGGRYNRLVEQLGGRSTPAAGFAVGLERVRLCVERAPAPGADAYLAAPGSAAAEAAALRLAERLRDERPALRLRMNMDGGSLKAQLRRADKSGARAALILGDAEAAAGTVVVKPLRGGGEQRAVAAADAGAALAELLEPEDGESWP